MALSSNHTVSWTSPAVQLGPTPLGGILHLAPTWSLLVGAFFVLQLVVIALNVLRQLVIPGNKSLPPEVFHVLPFVGSAIEYGNDPVNFFFRCREKYGDVFTFKLLGRNVTVALGPKGSDMILGGKPSVVSAEAAYTHFTTPVFGKEVVFDCPPEVFMQQKKFVKFGLNTENFRAYVGMIEDETIQFIRTDPTFSGFDHASRPWGKFHSYKTMSELIILTASRTLQGEEVRSRLGKEFAQLYHDLDGGFTVTNFMFPSLPLPSYWRRNKAQAAMSRFYQDIIQARRAGTAEHEHDMLTALQDQKYRNGRVLTDREIAHMMIALLMAGQHTSSASISWTLLHIADRSDIQQALYDEQVQHFGLENGKFKSMEYDNMKDLPILDAVIRETLRMHPPIHSLMRKVMKDLPVPSSLSAPSESSAYVIPKGYFVLASPLVAATDPKIWQNPTEWDPYRWISGDGVANTGASMALKDEESGEKVDYGFGMISKGTESPYQPFGAGRHRCIGETFAYVQLGTIIATLVRERELRLQGGVPAHNYHTMILVPKSPCDIEFRRRAI